MKIVFKTTMIAGWVLSAALSAACGDGADEDDTAGGADGDTDADADSDADGDADINIDTICAGTFEVDTELSSAISTVGIVEWSTTESGVTDASIQFGLTTDYEYTAPVDLNETDFRTLLLGMKPSETYHYRIVLHTDSTACASGDYTLTTGSPPTSLPAVTVNEAIENASAGGFIVSSSGSTAFILDKDGDFVWWYTFTKSSSTHGGGEGLGRAHISFDGQSMWGAAINVGGGSGFIGRISMDGLGTQESLSVEAHHDFAVLPNNGIAYIEFTDSDGDRIVERSADGSTRTVYTMSTDFSSSGGTRVNTGDWSHCNAIHYLPSDDAYSMSCLNLNLIIKVSRAGELIWALDGDGGDSDFTGVSWSRQHGHHLLDNGNLLIFNNGEGGFGGSGNSLALEFTLDTATWRAADEWEYDGSSSSSTLGDVQRLPNGNTLVTYSNSGKMHEVNSSAQPVRTITFGSGSGTGYADWRPTLYGAPARY